MYLKDSMSDVSKVYAIYTDLKKAFDLFDHGIPIYKLRQIGINELSSYISEWSKYVKIDNFISDEVKVTSGVPQCSYLSLLIC